MHRYDLERWLSSNDEIPLENFYSDTPTLYRYYLDQDIIPNFKKCERITKDVREIVYRMRINIIGHMSDRIFCYNREQESNPQESVTQLTGDDLS